MLRGTLGRTKYFFQKNSQIFTRLEKLNMKSISTKSINMSDIMLYLVCLVQQMILCFIGPHKMKMSNYFSILGTLWNLGLFLALLLLLFQYNQYKLIYSRTQKYKSLQQAW